MVNTAITNDSCKYFENFIKMEEDCPLLPFIMELVWWKLTYHGFNFIIPCTTVVVVMTTTSSVSATEAGIMTNLNFQWAKKK